MRLITAVLIFLISLQAVADVKISQLPLGSGASVLTNDSFPYVDTATATTKRLRISDIPNVPSFVNTVAAALVRTTNTITANLTVPTLTKDYILNVDTSFGPVTVTLPSAVLSAGFCIDVKNIGAPVALLTVNPIGGQFVDGNSTDTITGQYDSKHYCSVSGNWFVY